MNNYGGRGRGGSRLLGVAIVLGLNAVLILAFSLALDGRIVGYLMGSGKGKNAVESAASARK